MCDCFHLAFPNWHAASSGTGPGRRLRAPEPGTEDDLACDEPSQFTEGERPRPQGSSPVEEYPETEEYTNSDKECEAEHDLHHKSRSGKKTKKSGLGSMFEKRSTPKMSKLKEVHSPESGVIVKTAKDGCAEGLVYGGGGKEGIFIKQVVPESPASKSLKLKEGDQILSATVYFDNVSYEDAIQILEHAQAYKVKLCLKRKPEITETEPSIESDVIPEEDLYAPEMREQGKTKRRGDARISWPKFPSFGKGRKSRFTRSHSSSEADEQRKLELSPTTSDTESPIKTQDALKGKKRHKIKLPVLSKRGRISSSEDQEADTPTTGQISAKILQSHEASDMLSPECLESPSGQTPEVYVTEDLKVVEGRSDQTVTEPETVQHKVELITLDSTLKTEDLTVALAGNKSPPGVKSPDGKKKKKERSELKMKILGKEKMHKKDAKAKASPKRLKTLGASIEIPDKPETEKSDVIPSFESHTKLQGDQSALDTQIIGSETSTVISGKSVTAEPKVPKVELDIADVTLIRKSPQKSKDIKQKQETQTTFKLPKVGLSDIATEETVHKMNVNVRECTTKTEQLITEGARGKKDPYEQLSKSSLYRTQLPKREEIEIPGMEDMSFRTTAKGYKEPKTDLTGNSEESPAETVQLSIDVDSVKEAVSKLPGYKLPKVDTSGVPIPEEITVIDANAQRISVKTPTKVVDTKTKHETHFTKFDVTASPEISKTTIKLPKITPADLTSEELLIETKVDLKKPEKKDKSKTKQSDKDIKTEIYKREDIIIPGKESALEINILQSQGLVVTKSDYESADSPKESDKKSKKAKITTTGFGITKQNIKIPDIGIDLPKQTISQQKSDTIKEESTVFIQEIKTSRTETWKGKGQIGGVTYDIKIPEIDGIEYIDSTGSPNLSISMPIEKGPKMDISLSKKDVDVTLPDAKAEVKLPQVPEVDVTLGNIDVSVPQKKMKVKKPEFEIQPLQTDGERDGQGSKFKMPKLGIAMPKVKGPEIDLSFPKKDGTKPEAKANIKVPEDADMDVDVKQLQSEAEMDVQGSKFKMPKSGITMPKVKGPEIDFSSSYEHKVVTLPEAKVEIKGVEHTDLGIKTEVKAPGTALHQQDVDGSTSTFKMPTFKLPKFNVETPNVSVKGPDLDKDVKIKGADINIPEGSAVNIEGSTVDIEGPSIHMETTGGEQYGKGGKFKMPHLGFSMPKVKGPKMDLGLSKKAVDVTLPETKADITLPEVDLGKVDVSLPEAKMEVSEAKVQVKLPGAPKIDGSLGKAELLIPETEVDMPEMEMKPLLTEVEVQDGKFKMPKFGITMPKVKGPEIDFNFSKKSVDVTLPEAGAEVKLGEAHEIDVNLEKPAISIPEAKMEVKKPELKIKGLQSEGELDGQGSKFKMPKLGMSMPKLKGPDIDFNLSKKDVDITLPEAKADVSLPDVELKEPSAKVEIKSPEFEAQLHGAKGSPSKFKMPTFKFPKFGVATPNVSAEVPDLDKEIKIEGADIKIPEEVLTVGIAAPSIDAEGPSIEIKTTKTEHEGKGGRFKMPSLGFSAPQVKHSGIDLSLSKKDVDVTLPEAKIEAKAPEIELKEPSANVEIKAPEMKVTAKTKEGSPSKFKMPTFKLPKFSVGTPNVSVKGPDLDKDVKIKGTDINIPEEGSAVNIEAPTVDIEGPSIDMETTGGEQDGKGGKFKMPHLSFSVPKVKGPKIDLSQSKKAVDVTLPEAKADITLPEVDLGKVDVSLPEAKMEIPEAKAEVKLPEAPKIAVEGKHPEYEAEMDGHSGGFKMPKFGIKMPTVKGPEFDFRLPKKDVDVKLPETKADITLPEVDLGKVDVSLPQAKMEVPEAKVEVKLPEAPKIAMEMQPPECEAEMDGHGGRFKFPKFGIKMPEFDMSLSKKDPDVTLPQTKVEVTLPDAPKVDVSHGKAEVLIPDVQAKVEKPDLEIKGLQSEGELEGQGSKFKMPKLGMTMPKLKGPDIDFSLSKKDVDIALPEAKADVSLPDVELKEPSAKVEIKSPEFEAQLHGAKGSPSKFKMPTFKFPKFGVATPNVSAEVPDLDKEIKIEGADIKIPEEVLTVGIATPSIDAEGPSIEIKTTKTEHEGKGGKFKMPSLGFSAPQVKHSGIDLSLSKKDVDVTLPEAKIEAKAPEIELKEPSAKVEIKAPEMKVTAKAKEGSPSKFKMPTFKLPKFSVGTPNVSVKGPDLDKDVKIKGADINIPEEGSAVNIEAPTVDIEGPSIDMETTGGEQDGKGGKFKMPHLSFSVPKVKGPKIDLSQSKKAVDVTLPEAKADITLPEVDLGKVDVSLPEAKMEIPEAKAKVKLPEAPKIAVEGKHPEYEAEMDGHGGGFKMPKFGIKMPTVKGPEFDFRLPKKDVDVKLPETKADITLPEVDLGKVDVSLPQAKMEVPEAKVEVKLPEAPKIAMEMQPPECEAEMDGHGGRFRFPKFGIKMPEFDMSLSKKDPDVTLPQTKVEVTLPDAPKVDVSHGKAEVLIPDVQAKVEKPDLEIKGLQSEGELEGQGSKFKMPKLGMTMPKLKGPDIDFSLSKKDVDITLPEAKADVSLPDVELKEPSAKVEIKSPEFEAQLHGTKGSPSKFKMPTFKFPKFGVATPNVSAEVPDLDKEIKIEGADIKIPEEVLTVGIAAPSIDTEGPSIEIKTTKIEHERKGGKFKMPSLSFSAPQVKHSGIDLSLSKKDVDVTLPEAKIEAKAPEIELKEPSAQVEIKAPEMKVTAKAKEGSPSKFKMPTFKLPKFSVGTPNVSVKGPDLDKDVKIKGADINIPEEGSAVNIEAPTVDIEGPSIDMETTGGEQDGKGGKFKMPHLSFSVPKVKGPKIDLSQSKKAVDVTLPEAKADITLPEVDLGKVDVSLPEAKMEIPEAKAKVKLPEAPKIAVEGKHPEYEAEMDGHGGGFKMPKFGIKMPTVKGPEFDFRLPKKDVDAKLPETKADITLPEVDLGKVDVSLPQAKMEVPEAKVEVKLPEAPKIAMEMQPPECEAEMDGHGGRFKFPKFGIKMPEFDMSLSKKDPDVTLPQTKVEVTLPDVPKVDVSHGKAEVLILDVQAKVEKPDLEIKSLQTEDEGQGDKFKMPKFGMTMPKLKGPEFHLGFSKKDGDITLPEAKAEVSLPEVDVKEPSAKIEMKAPEVEVVSKDIDGSSSKLKMPNFSVSMPKVKGPDLNLSLSKKDTDTTLPGFKADVKLPGAPEIDASLGKAEVVIPEAKMEVKKPEVEMTPLQTDVDLEGQGSKFKMPKFGITVPKLKGPEIDFSLSKKDVDVTLPEAKAEVELPEVPKIHVDVEPPECEADIDGKGSKFKMPKFGISVPKVKGPEIDFNLSKKDIDVALPEAKADVSLPDVELKKPSAKVEIKSPEVDAQVDRVKGSPLKFKMPTFKTPKFGVATPNVEVDKEIKIDGADIKIPEEVLTVDIAAPSIDTEGPSIDMKAAGAEHEGKGSKFKMPSFSFSMSQVKQPDIDLSISKKDVDVTLPEAKAEVQLPDLEAKESSAKVEIKAPGIDAQASNLEASPSKFKMPTFKMPKFGASTAQVSVETPDVETEIKVDGADLKLPQTKAEVEFPDVEIKEPVGSVSVSEVPLTDGDAKVKKTRFSFPKFSFSKQKTKEAEVDASVPHIDVSLPEGTVEVIHPEVVLSPSDGDVALDGQGGKFRLPKFGIAVPKVKGPEIDLSLSKKDIDVAGAEGKTVDKDMNIGEAKLDLSTGGATMEVTAPSIDTKGISVDVKSKGSELEGSGSKFTMPKFGISMPKVKGPEIDLSLSKKDVDYTIPEAKAEGELSDVKIKQLSAKVDVKAPQIEAQAGNVEGSPSKFKMPSFTLPKFGAATPKVSVEVPDVDKDITIDGAKVEVPRDRATVDVRAPNIETEGLSVDVKAEGSETEVSGSKFKMPKFGISMPKVKGPEIDLSSSKKDVDVTIPEAKAEVQPLDAKVSVQAPQIEARGGNVEGSPSKFKMPSFTLPRFGAGTPKASVDIPDVDKDITIDGAKVKVSKERATVDVTAPSIDAEGLSVDVKAKGSELEVSGSKFKMPKFGISMPKVKGPEIDLSSSKKDVDVTLPEVKAEGQLPDVEMKQPSTKVDVKAPQIEAQVGNVEGSPSKFKMPSFTLPKFGAGTPKVSVEVPDVDKDINIEGAKLQVPIEEAAVDVTAPSIDTEGLSVDVKAKGSELEGSGGKFKMPKFGISMPKVKGPEIDLSSSKKDVDVTLPEAKAEVQPLDAKVSVQAPQIEAQAGNVEGSPSKLKMPSFTLPKFGAGTAKVSVEVPDVDKDIKIEGAKLQVPTEGATVEVTAPSIDTEGKFKMPKFGISMPKVKGPEIDLSSSKKDADITLPEAKAEGQLTDVKVKEPEGAISVPDAPTVELEAKMKRTNWTFPKFSFSRTGGKTPDADVNLETPQVDATLPDAKAEASLPEVEVQGSSGAAELDANMKKTKFSLPRFSFSKSTVKAPEVSAELPHVDVSLPEGEVKVKEPVMEIKLPELEVENDGQERKFKLPKFGIALPKAKGPEDLHVSHKDGDITLPEVKAEVKLPEIEVKSTASVNVKASETEAKSKDVGGSPLKFKMPALKMPKLEGGTFDVTVDAPDADKETETNGAKLQEDITLTVSSVDIKMDVCKAAATDTEIPKAETDNVGLGSPSKFKLPSFKMPKLSFSRSRPEGEFVDENEGKEEKLQMEVEPKGESKSPKMTLTSFGEILKNIDVEFDVPKTDAEQEDLETSKAVHETDGKQTEPKEKEMNTKQETAKSPERTGWFKFPRFGLSSPSEPAKPSEKDEVRDKQSPVEETTPEEISPTCSVQSSDAFADISSAMTSEHAGPSLSSPTKVTVKYSDPNTVTGLKEMHSNIITSTTRTELISVEPNLPEKITILSSGVSSSSEDTVRLESGKIHIITSNIHATPETEFAKAVTAAQVRTAEGLPLKSDDHETASWTVEDSQGGKRTVFERHLVRETSSERSESKETIVITKQITRVFDSSEPISGETASSIQRLKDTVHSDKMRFFDGAEK